MNGETMNSNRLYGAMSGSACSVEFLYLPELVIMGKII